MPENTQGSNVPRRVAALVLAAGRSSRMGGNNKLVAELDGIPVVAAVIRATLSSQARPVIVVTGHDSDQVKRALIGYDVSFVHNRHYFQGMSTSLRRGIAALPSEIDGMLVCLGDMPWIAATHIERLISRFDPAEGRAICVPTFEAKSGNPVLWAKRFFHEMCTLTGDVGARGLITNYAELVCEVEMADNSVLIDIDTTEDLASLRRART